MRKKTSIILNLFQTTKKTSKILISALSLTEFQTEIISNCRFTIILNCRLKLLRNCGAGLVGGGVGFGGGGVGFFPLSSRDNVDWQPYRVSKADILSVIPLSE